VVLYDLFTWHILHLWFIVPRDIPRDRLAKPYLDLTNGVSVQGHIGTDNAHFHTTCVVAILGFILTGYILLCRPVFFILVKYTKPPMKCHTATSYAKGVAAEHLAAEYLQKMGYILLHKRYKTRYGELDVVMHRGDTLVFIEVKNREKLSDGLYALTLRQQQRLWQAGEYFLQNHTHADPWSTIRFDIVVIALSRPPGTVLAHMENILGQA
jgi:putative endonuclease